VPSRQTTSVKVPPMSTPISKCPAASAITTIFASCATAS
jgi:hypothetical protein